MLLRNLKNVEKKQSIQIIVDFKNQIQEAKKIEEDLELQLKKRIQNSERLEAEIIQLKKKCDEKYIKKKFVNNSKTLDDILNDQRPSSDKTGLGYNKKSYVVALMSPIEKKDSQKYASRLHKTNMVPRRSLTSRYQQIFFGHCYSCNNFGHKAVNCKAYGKVHFYKKNAPSNNPKERNHNSFAPL